MLIKLLFLNRIEIEVQFWEKEDKDEDSKGKSNFFVKFAIYTSRYERTGFFQRLRNAFKDHGKNPMLGLVVEDLHPVLRQDDDEDTQPDHQSSSSIHLSKRFSSRKKLIKGGHNHHEMWLKDQTGVVFCVAGVPGAVTRHLVEGWENREKFVGKFSLTLVLNDEHLGRLFNFNPEGHSKQALMVREMLEKEIGTDVVIISGGDAMKETSVRCHKSVLGTRSGVFRKLFDEGNGDHVAQLEMEYMSERGVRAFLKYLYFWEVDKAVERSDVALGLLMAGVKYEMGELVSLIRDLMMVKPEIWFGVKVVEELEGFLGERGDEQGNFWGDLKVKVRQVLEWFKDLNRKGASVEIVTGSGGSGGEEGKREDMDCSEEVEEEEEYEEMITAKEYEKLDEILDKNLKLEGGGGGGGKEGKSK